MSDFLLPQVSIDMPPKSTSIFDCKGCNDFGCLPPGVWEKRNITETKAYDWMESHNLLRTNPAMTIWCNNKTHAALGAQKCTLVESNGNHVWRCKKCRKSVPAEGPLLLSWNQSGAKDIMNCLMCYASLFTNSQTVDISVLNKNTVTAKFELIENLLASWMRYHEFVIGSYVKRHHDSIRNRNASLNEDIHDPVSIQAATEDLPPPENDDPLAVQPRPVHVQYNAPREAEVARLRADFRTKMLELHQDHENWRFGDPIALDHAEADEVHVGHRMYEAGTRVAEAGTHIFQSIVAVDVFGKVADFVIRPILDKSADTLLSFIGTQVPPGSVLATDCWRAYMPARDIYDHTTVQHNAKRNKFVNIENGTTTNCVEAMHRMTRRMIKERHGKIGRLEPKRLASIMAHAVLALGSLTNVNGNRLRFVCICIREFAQSGWPLWEPAAESAVPPIEGMETNVPPREREEDGTPRRADDTRGGHRPEEALSPTRLFATADGTQWVMVPVPQLQQQQLQPQQTFLTQVPLTQAVQMPLTQPAAGGQPRTPVFARNQAVAAAAGRGAGGRGRGRPRGRGRGRGRGQN